MATIKDVAAYTGVSPTTVSNVIHGRDSKVSPETKDKVKKALKELDYTANMGGRLLAKHGSKIIGMIIQDTEAEKEEFYDNPYHGELIQAVESKIKKAGYFMMFHRVSTFEEGAKLAEMWHLEGLIVSGTSSRDVPKWQEHVSVPIVFLDSYGEGAEQPFLNVGIDDQEGAFEMTEYLLSKGHKQIIFLAKGNSPSDWQGVDCKRAEGVKKSMSKHGLHPTFLAMPITYRNYQTFIHKVLQSQIKNHSAIFCASDLLAVQIISEFYKLGIEVPEDISIVSFDGTLFSRYATPQITSISQDIGRKAEAIMNLMLKGIQSKNTLLEEVRLKTQLIEGESVANFHSEKN